MPSLADLLMKLTSTGTPAAAADIAAAESALGPLAPDLKAFFLHTDGYEGFIHAENYLVIYPVGELVELNRGYEVQEVRPELVLFGGTGGGDGYFLDSSTPGPSILCIAFISDWHADAIRCASSFTDFLSRQIEGRSPFESI